MSTSAAVVTLLVANARAMLSGSSTMAEPTAIAVVAPCRVRSLWRWWMRSAASTVVPPVMTVAPIPAHVVRIT